MGITWLDDWRDQRNGGEWEENSEHIIRSSPTIGGLITIRISSLKNTFLLLLVVRPVSGLAERCEEVMLVLSYLGWLWHVTEHSALTVPGYHWLLRQPASGKYQKYQPAGYNTTIITGISIRSYLEKNKTKHVFSQNSCQAFNVQNLIGQLWNKFIRVRGGGLWLLRLTGWTQL